MQPSVYLALDNKKNSCDITIRENETPVIMRYNRETKYNSRYIFNQILDAAAKAVL
jgi:hypothetical protein